MDCSVLILSCDSYSDCWSPFFQLKDKYWKDCPYETYVATETKDCKYAKALKHNYPIDQWTTRIREALKEIKTKYVLLMVDDFFIRDYVDQKRIDYVLKHFDDNTAFFNFEQEYDNNNVECGLDGFKKRINGICKISCQAGIWNREKLIKLLNISCSPWEWERLNIAKDYDYYINSSDCIIDYGFKVGDFSIVHGKWSQEIVPFFEKESIEIDYSKRGFFLSKNKFSIVIPNYNNSQWIKQCIDSVKNQTYRNWEIFIVDDMSTDNSVDVIEKTIKGYKNITLMQNEIKLYNGGSRNVGILQAKKSNKDGYLLFVDSDDWLADNKVIEELSRFIELNNYPDVITMGYQYFMNNQTKGSFISTYDNKLELFKADGKTMCAVWCKCFKVSKAPLFEYNTLMEDRNYHYRLINRCETYANFPRITHTWNRMNIKSITTDKDQLYKSELQATIKWDNCSRRHVAGMLDLLEELKDEEYKKYIREKIQRCEENIRRGIHQQL